jgi:hypothetical protein
LPSDERSAETVSAKQDFRDHAEGEPDPEQLGEDQPQQHRDERCGRQCPLPAGIAQHHEPGAEEKECREHKACGFEKGRAQNEAGERDRLLLSSDIQDGPVCLAEGFNRKDKTTNQDDESESGRNSACTGNSGLIRGR